jgi:hypothetical protein
MTLVLIISILAWIWSYGVIHNYGPDEHNKATSFWTHVNFFATIAVVISGLFLWLG